MKYYEVRCNRDNTRVCLLRTGFMQKPEGEIIFEGEHKITKAFEDMKDGFYRPEFKGYDQNGIQISITKDKLKKIGINERHYTERLDWVVNDSDHRKDVRDFV